ncbi:MAG: hypothetical protein NZ765_12380 [Anaerolineae bacterium]|nr:hypothetical protein [Anaerolineae bacterium]
MGHNSWRSVQVYVYNVCRPHSVVGMDHQPLLAVLHRLGYTGDAWIALVLPVLLDAISTDLLLSCDPETSNDLFSMPDSSNPS